MPENEDNIEVDNQGEPQEPKPNKYFNLRFDTDPDLSIYGFKELFFNLLPLNLTKLFAIVFLASVTISIGSGLCLYLAWAIEGGYQNSFSSVTDGIEALMAFNTDVFQIDDVVAYYSSSFLLASVGLSFLLLVISTMKFFKSASKPRIVVVILLILAVVGSVVAYSVIYLTDTPDFLISGTPVHSASLVEKTMIPFCVFLVASIAFVIVTYGEIMSEEYYKATWGSLILSLGIVGLVILTLENIIQMVALLMVVLIIIVVAYFLFPVFIDSLTGGVAEGVGSGGSSSDNSSGAGSAKRCKTSSKPSKTTKKPISSSKKAPSQPKNENHKGSLDLEICENCAYIPSLNDILGYELWNAKITIIDNLKHEGERGIFVVGSYSRFLCTVEEFSTGKFKIISKKTGKSVKNSDIKYKE